MGANKFGPPRWRGWSGDSPPFHTPTYALEQQYEVEVVSTPSGVTHLTFTR